MDTQSTPTASPIDDLFTLILVDGLTVESNGKPIKYMTLKLRETGVADERIAQRLSERVVMVGGVHKLLVSDADFRYGLTVRHIEAFVCDGQKIPQALIDWELVGKLSSHDLGMIEQRVFLITLAAEVRYGNMSQAEFDAIVMGRAPTQASPQREGQAADVGQASAESQPGPALLADFTGNPASGTPSGDIR